MGTASPPRNMRPHIARIARRARVFRRSFPFRGLERRTGLERARLIQIIIRDGSLESEQMKKHPYEWQFSPLSDAGIRQITRDAVSRECSRDEFISLWKSNSDYIRPSRKGLHADSRMRADIALIWDRVHLSLREIRELRGLSQSDLAGHLGIPVPVIEEWEKDGCPDYLRLLISEVLGLIKR